MRLQPLLQQRQFPAIFCIAILDVVLSVSVTIQLDVNEPTNGHEENAKLANDDTKKTIANNSIGRNLLPFQHSNESIEWDSICAMYHI